MLHRGVERLLREEVLMRYLLLPLILVLAASPFACAAEVIAPANERFAKPSDKETPSFQRHVLPLMGRLGCNGRACHGSFQGQGGFRLSLFGYDFKSDHDALLLGKSPRVEVKEPAESLLLQKPTTRVGHKGGKRLDVDSWQYNLMLRWIQAGAVGVKESDPSFVTLDIQPREIVFKKVGEKQQLKVIARWSDGLQEDVTPLCRFQSNNDTVAAVDAAGVVNCLGKGDTDIVAFYDNGVVTVPVLLPVSDLVGDRYPKVNIPTKVDELVVARLRHLGIVPSEVCSDAEFLRRLSLDLTGTPPASEEVAAFLADKSTDKRAKKIDELLDRPSYAAWWATKLCDFTGNSERNGPLGGEQSLNRDKARQWYFWTYRRVKENMPYDKIVEGIVMAVGRKSTQSYEEFCSEMSSYFRKDKPADFTERETMPYFWTRKSVGSAEEKALSFAHAFLGVNLQCAQCHKHPYDQWTKTDFDQFTLFFNGIRYGGGKREVVAEMKKTLGLAELDEDSGTYKRKFVTLLQEGKTLPFKELNIPATSSKGKKPATGKGPSGRVLTPKLLGGEEVVNRDYSDARQPLMDWLRDEEHPYFAQSIVNRVWASYFHVGLINPSDDLNLANPPSNRALMDYLAQEFIKNKYDLKWLHRQIANSDTYQRSWRPNETNKQDERNFSRAVLRRLPAEVAYDALVLATASDTVRKTLDADPANTLAIGVVSSHTGARDPGSYAVTLFGKPPRVVNCDCERSLEPSVLQTVYLRNDDEVLKLIDRADGWLKQVVKAKESDPEKLARQAYLRVLSRLPDDKEREIAVKHLKNAKDTTIGLRDLLWALLNTKEFIVNR